MTRVRTDVLQTISSSSITKYNSCT